MKTTTARGKLFSKITIAAIVFIFFSQITLKAQEAHQAEETNQDDLYNLSLEDLMEITIQSASKKDETLFDAPLSSYTITKSDIEKTGATSIMEALRLSPGVIVRELANGVYDIHIRGFDNSTRNQRANGKINFATLVMIDDRPVFNSVNGGTDWETLPVGIGDVERIEIVRGPSAALFGPNAVSGVVNIITKKVSGEKLNVSADVSAGNAGTHISNLSIGKRIQKWNFLLSGNIQNRERFTTEYYSLKQKNLVSPENLVLATLPNGTYKFMGEEYRKEIPDPSLALKRWGANAFITYTPSEKAEMILTFGTTKSDVQKMISSSAPDTYFGSPHDNTKYLSFQGHADNFKFRASHYQKSTDPDPNGSAFFPPLRVIAAYDNSFTDGILEYDIKVKNDFKLTPGVSYQHYEIDDTPYNDHVTTIGFYSGKHSLETFSGYLRSDLTLSKFRIIAALRADKFSVPDKVYLNYELASTYKINESNLVRLAVTRSNSGSFFRLNYTEITFNGNTLLKGNQNLKQFTIDMMEAGFRSKFSSKLHLDVDLFRQVGSNYSVSAVSGNISTYLNIPYELTQHGITTSLNYSVSDKLQLKPFFTWQHTKASNLPENFIGTSYQSNTPSFYGGYSMNYQATEKLNINLNGYYFSSHRQFDNNDTANTNPIGAIDGKILVNAKVSYAVIKNLRAFVNVRNGLNSKSREFYSADETSALFLGGLTFNMK